jgi:HEPN domain-containing protein
MKKPHDEWIYYADQDLLAARSLLKDGVYPHVCYHAQQAVEKMLKAVLVSHDKPYPKSHDLIHLNAVIGRPEWLAPHEDHMRLLSQFNIPVRYPDAMAGTLPDRLPGKDDATDALTWAEEICQLIREKI